MNDSIPHETTWKASHISHHFSSFFSTTLSCFQFSFLLSICFPLMVWTAHFISINTPIHLSIYLSFSPFFLSLSLSVCSGWERPHRTQKQRGIVFWVKCGKQTLVDGPSGCWQADTLPNAAGTWALVLGKPWVMAAVARGIYESGTWLILGASGVECEFRPHRKVTPSLSFSLPH